MCFVKPTLIVMVKEPRPGRVKTRLGRSIGMTNAASWFRHQTQYLLHRLRDPRWELVLAVTPDREGQLSRVWPRDLRRIPQGRGDLGRRMIRAMRHFKGPVCLIGADIPDITTRHISHAFGYLGSHEAVFGPSPDGGYWLIGLRASHRVPTNVFDGVAWSTKDALSQSQKRLGHMRTALADTLRDVDTVADLP